MIVPIGIDCGIAGWCKNYNLRSCSLPFDWNVTYSGVSDCIANNFEEFIPRKNEKINKYRMAFPHDFDKYENDKLKYMRRIERLTTILETSREKIIFVRKGHAPHNHNESIYIKNDIDDVEMLDKLLSKRYPNLNYVIHLILICGQCFDSNINYTSDSEQIKIHNISMLTIHNEKVENTFKSIVLS
jgi:hypothetical protein